MTELQYKKTEMKLRAFEADTAKSSHLCGEGQPVLICGKRQAVLICEEGQPKLAATLISEMPLSQGEAVATYR